MLLLRLGFKYVYIAKISNYTTKICTYICAKNLKICNIPMWFLKIKNLIVKLLEI